MKIKRITVENFKAISKEVADFNGCSAIITGGNNRGKTSLLSGLISRLQGEKPELIVKKGEEKGMNMIELTDGSIIEWNFTEKSERLSFTTKEGLRVTSGVISGIGGKYFGRKFDIDAFLNKPPKMQNKELQSILGLDLDKIEAEYATAYAERTEANRELKRLRAIDMKKPEKVEKPDVESIRERVRKARSRNDEIIQRKAKRDAMQNKLDDILHIVSGSAFSEHFDQKGAQKMIDEVKLDPLISISGLELQLEKANELLRKHDMYERDLSEYNKWLKECKRAKKEAEAMDAKVKSIEKEKLDMIASAKMPEGFEMSDDGLLYNGFPLSENQLSQSAKYIAALKLGEMILGDVRTLHFDASSLDNNSLKEVQEWAESKDLQLLIERPDFEGGNIKYEILEI